MHYTKKSYNIKAGDYSWKNFKAQTVAGEKFLGKSKVNKKDKTRKLDDLEFSGTYNYSKC